MVDYAKLKEKVDQTISKRKEKSEIDFEKFKEEFESDLENIVNNVLRSEDFRIYLDMGDYRYYPEDKFDDCFRFINDTIEKVGLIVTLTMWGLTNLCIYAKAG